MRRPAAFIALIAGSFLLNAAIVGAQQVSAPQLITFGPTTVDGPKESVASRADLGRDLRPSDSVTHRKAAIVGGVVGAVVGGLGAAGYILNATAYRCTTPGPPCPYDPHTTRRVIVITTGTVSGAAIGAWIAHRIVRRP
jgi:hypothetical protein